MVTHYRHPDFDSLYDPPAIAETRIADPSYCRTANIGECVTGVTALVTCCACTGRLDLDDDLELLDATRHERTFDAWYDDEDLITVQLYDLRMAIHHASRLNYGSYYERNMAVSRLRYWLRSACQTMRLDESESGL